jgi:hypothetical protein
MTNFENSIPSKNLFNFRQLMVSYSGGGDGGDLSRHEFDMGHQIVFGKFLFLVLKI